MRKIGVPVYYFYLVHALAAASLAALVFISYTAYPLAWIKVFFPERNPITVAHRGASAYAPENTMPAFELALEMGADYLEIDVQMTKDGHLVAIHDDRVDRTTNGTGAVGSLTLAELEALDAGSWFNEAYPIYAKDTYREAKVPALRDIFDTFSRRVNYMLELKDPSLYPGIEEKLLALIDEFGVRNSTAIHSFSAASLKKIHRLDERIPLYQLLWYNWPAFISQSSLEEIKTYAVGVSPNYNRISPQYISKVRDAGLKIMPYTINYQTNMERAMSLGVNGIYTDYPDRFRALILKHST